MPPTMITTDVLPSAQFKILTGTLKAFQGDDGRKRLSGVASSTVRDLHGDTMAQSAILDMERAANDNLTIFLNHSYNVPEDVFGSVEKATAVQRGMDSDGNPNWDLLMDIVVDDGNDRALKTFDKIKTGTKLGLSIGAMIPEGGAERVKETGALIINHVYLLETSVVSIPANPRSWISNAVKALRKANAEEVITETTTETTIEIVNTTTTNDETVVVTEDAVETAEKAADESTSQEAPLESQPGAEAVPAMIAAAEAGASPEPEVSADLSDQLLDPAVRAAVAGVSATIEAMTAKMAGLVEQLEEEKQARKAAEMQRDTATEAAHSMLAEVRSIMERVSQTPVGRKTQFVSAKGDFDHLDQVYSEPFRKLLKQGDTR